MLDVSGLTFWYPNAEHPVLRGVDLRVGAGEVVVLTGPSGCGKSTLLHCVRGLTPSVYGGRMEGAIMASGTDVASQTVAGLSAAVGLVMQEPAAQLCNLTVATEVAFGVENLQVPSEECRERVREALELVSLSDKAADSVDELSGGECQRLAIASVIAMRPSVLLLDEPTATLDTTAAAEVIAVIERLRDAGHAIIVVQHDFDELLARADRMVVLEDGRITHDGAPHVVVAELAAADPRPVALPAVTALAARLGLRAAHGGLPLTPEELVEAVERLGAPAIGEPLPAVDATRPGTPHVRAEHVSFRYPGRRAPAVRDVSLTFREGEVVALVGRNGSGKSTLARMLVGLLPPADGRVVLDGAAVARLKVRKPGHSTGYVFQFPEHQFVTSTVSDEMAYGLRIQGRPQDEIDAAVADAAARLGLADKLDRHPFSLSGGEKRRLSVATMLVLHPRLLVLDEPTYGLDEGNLSQLVSLLFDELRKAGTTIVFITHDMRLVAEHADHVVAMSNHEAVFQGPPGELFADDRLTSMGLAEPPLARVARGLRAAGWPVPRGALTVDALAAAVAAARPAGRTEVEA